MITKINLLIIALFFLITSCSTDSNPHVLRSTQNLKGEYIYRHHDEHFFTLESPTLVEHNPYPWDNSPTGKFAKISKEYFRCKGSSLNPVRIVQKDKETLRFYDCGGTQKHSLPLKDEKEFVYPILIDLLNYLQDKTVKKVVITSAHCCQEHSLYLDSSIANQSSKHQIGAEVDFYIQGMENQPQKVVDLILNYYKEIPKYKDLKEFQNFDRYEKSDTNVSTKPWFNKEIFIKLNKKDEGRDFDNRHTYPYITLQVKYDWDSKERVTYSWDKAFKNLHRW